MTIVFNCHKTMWTFFCKIKCSKNFTVTLQKKGMLLKMVILFLMHDKRYNNYKSYITVWHNIDI